MALRMTGFQNVNQMVVDKPCFTSSWDEIYSSILWFNLSVMPLKCHYHLFKRSLRPQTIMSILYLRVKCSIGNEKTFRQNQGSHTFCVEHDMPTQFLYHYYH